LDQLFSNDSCLNSSCSEQLDSNSCPGCGDSFLLPTTFFQHLYRRSVRIRFECRGCDGVKYLEFTNKCLFRLHLLSHLELGEEGLEPGLLELSSLQPSEMLEINSNSSSSSIFSSLHRRTQNQLARAETEVQCMECLQVGLCLLNIKNFLPVLWIVGSVESASFQRIQKADPYPFQTKLTTVCFE